MGFKATRASPLPAPQGGTGADYAAAVPDYRTAAQAQVAPGVPPPSPHSDPPAVQQGAAIPNQQGYYPLVANSTRSDITDHGTHEGGPAADVFAPIGSPIYAPVGGTITAVTYSKGGNTATLKGDDGRWYYMAHGNVPFTGGRVEAGQQIGQVGDTGNAKGGPSHVHFAITDDGDFSRGVNGGSGNIWPTTDLWTSGGATTAGGIPAWAPASGEPPTDIEAFVRQRAAAYGIDPDVAVRVAQSEGGLESWNRQSDYVYQGTRETSFGPMQLLLGGGLGDTFLAETGLDPRDPANGPAATDWALRYAAQHGWADWHGAQRIGLDNFAGIGATTPTGTPLDPRAFDASRSTGRASTSPFAPAEQPYAAATAYDPNADPSLNPFGQFLPDPIGMARQGARTASGAIGGASDFLRGGSTTPEAQGWTAGSPNQPDLAPRADVLASLDSAPPIPGSPDWLGHQALEALDRPNRAVRSAFDVRTQGGTIGESLEAAGQGFAGRRPDISHQEIYERANPALKQRMPDGVIRAAMASNPVLQLLGEAIIANGGVTYAQAMGAATTVVADPLNALEVLGLAGRGVRLAGTEGVEAIRLLGRVAERVAPEIADRALLAGGQGVRDMAALGLAPDVGGEARAAIKARQAFPDAEAQFEQQAAGALGRRMYHGTGSAFDTPSADRFDPNGLFGPGYYLTDSADVAGAPTHIQNPDGTVTRVKGGYAFQRQYPQEEIRITAQNAAYWTRKAEELAAVGQDNSGALDTARKAYAELDTMAGPNVRAVDVPEGLRLLDADAPITTQEIESIASTLPSRSRELFENILFPERDLSRMQRLAPQPPKEYTGGGVYDALTHAAGLHDVREGGLLLDHRTVASRFLKDAGFDGIRYAGGKRIPMADAAGNAIEHTAVVIFPESLPKIRNAISGTAMGRAVNRTEQAAGALGRRNVVRPTSRGSLAGTPEEVARATVIRDEMVRLLSTESGPSSMLIPLRLNDRSAALDALGGENRADWLIHWWESSPDKTEAVANYARQAPYDALTQASALRSADVRGLGGSPLRGYHGTAVPFDTPDPSTFGRRMLGRGYWVDLNPDVASAYALEGSAPGRVAGTVHEGAQIRPVDIPSGTDLFDFRATVTPESVERIRRALVETFPFTGRPGITRQEGGVAKQFADEALRGRTPGVAVYDRLTQLLDTGARDIHDPGGAVEKAQKVLTAAGYDGIIHDYYLRDGGPGDTVSTAVVIFPESLSKIRNAISGVAMGRAADKGENIPRPRRSVVRRAGQQPQPEAAPLFEETRAPTFGGRQLTPADAGGGSAEFPVLDAQGAAARAEQAAQGPGLFGAEFALPPEGPRQVSLGEAPPVEPPADLPTATGGTPDPLVGNAVRVASPADPTVAYDARYRVVSLDDLTTSHTDAFTPTAGYPAEMQPRLRDRAGAQLQVQHIASTLEPDALLANAGRTDAGPPIVGPDLMVESGNGRTLALRLARDQFPDRWAAYQDRLAQRAAELGIDPAAVRGVRDPVLVLERQTAVDRAAFAAEANASPTLAMGPFEQALQDARRIPADVLAAVDVPAGSNIEAALRGPKALPLVKALLARFPANERAALMDADGSLNAAGLTRIKNALFAAVYPGEAGKRLTQAFVESADPTLKNVEAGLFASLPQMARAEGLIRTGARDASLSLSGDLAAAVDVLARLRQQGVRVADYVGQQSIFERELTPTQEQLLVHLDSLARNPRRVREFVTRYADAVEAQAHSDQAGLFGAVEPADKGALLERASHGAIEADTIGDGPAAGAAAWETPAAAPDAAGAGLERPPAGTGGPQAPRPDPAAAPGRVDPTLPTEPIVPSGLRRARPVPSQRVLPDMPSAGIPTRPATRAGFAGRLNVSKFPTTIQDALRAAYETDPAGFEAASRGVIPDAEVARMATEVDIAPLMEKWAPGTVWNAEEITAARTVVARTFADVAKAARGADSTEGNAAFAEAVRRAQSISGAGSELGRGLRSLRGTAEADALLNWREAARGGVEDAFARVNGVHDDIEAIVRSLPEEAQARALAALDEARAAADEGYQAAKNGVADHPVEPPSPNDAQRAPEGQQAAPPPEVAPDPTSAVDANGRPLTRKQQTALEREKIRQEFALARYGKRLEELTAREKTIVDGATAREAMRQERIGQSDRLSADYKAQLEQQKQAAKDARTAYSERIKLEREREAAAQSTRAAAERGRIAGQQAHELALRAAEDRHAQAMVKLFDAITDPARRNNVRALVNTLGGRNGNLTPWQQAAKSIRVAQRGRAITPDQQQRLYKNLIKAVTGTDDAAVQAQRITQLRQIVQRNDTVAMGRLLQEANQPGFWDNLMAYRSAGLLTGLATHVRNIMGNSVSLASSPAERALAMPIDVARATITGAPRERFAGEIPRELAGWHHAFPEAWSRFTAIMRYGFDPADLEGLANVRGESTIPIAKYPINTVFRGLGGMDAFFRHLSSQGEIRALAYRQARMEGLTGDALIRRTADLIDVPSVTIIEQAQKTARYRTFRQEMEGLGKGLNNLAREFPPFRLVMPFISTPYNIIKYDLERSPLGALSILADLKRGSYNPASKQVLEHPEQLKEMGDLSDRIARLVIGATVLYGASTLYAGGEMTGNGPPDPGERDLWLRDHQPNSVKIGGVWVSWQNIPGVSTNLGVITGVMDTQQYGKGDAGQQALGGVQGAIRAITQRSFLSGMADLAAAIAPGGGAGAIGQRYITNTAASFLPASALLRRTAQGLDPEVKQPIGLAEQFTQNIPGLSRTVKPRPNRSGEPITRDTRLAGLDFPGSALAGSLLNPALIDIPENDPMVAEAARTGVALPSAGNKVAGQDLTPEQQRRYAIVLGQRADAYRTQLYASTLYATANEATKQALAEKANNEARTDARDQVMAELGIPPARRQGEPDLYDMATVGPALARYWTPEQAAAYAAHPYLLEVDIRRAQRVFTDYVRSHSKTAKPTRGELILAKLGQTKFRSPAWRLWSHDAGRSQEQATTDDFFNRLDAQTSQPVGASAP